MEENLNQTESMAETQNKEPITQIDNSNNEHSAKTEINTSTQNGQSEDPNNELILGKFKTVDDLSKAYQELQKHQGDNSQELGDLRKESSAINNLKENLEQVLEFQSKMTETILADKEKYNTPEYFQEETFRDLYKEAFVALEGNIDTEKFINLLDGYVNSRITAYIKNQNAQQETQNIVDSMTYEKNPKSTFTPPKKSFDEMSPQEIDDLVERLI